MGADLHAGAQGRSVHGILKLSNRNALGNSASDRVPFTQTRATLSDLAEQVKAGAEKIINKNGQSDVALIDAQRLDHYHRLERKRIHLLLIDDARRSLEDIAEGRTQDSAADAAGRCAKSQSEGQGEGQDRPAARNDTVH
jgi:antitoxin (DNA-binding transcriptional repressor) of toxin-antitoxin stability system